MQFTVRSVKPELQPISGSDKDEITQTYVLLEQDGNTSLSIEHGDFSMLAHGEKIRPGAMTVWDKVLPKIKELAEK